jgi:glycosyltransferase involved in cell wall biosynthesis
MKILHVIPSFGLGGMEKVISSIINHTALQYKHFILSLDGNNQAFRWLKNNDTQQIRFRKEASIFVYFRQLYREIVKISPDLLMTYNWGGTDAVWIGRIARIRNIVHHEHGFSIEEAHTTAKKRDICRFIVYRMVSTLVTVSSDLGSSIQKRYWLHANHVKIIPNGIDINHYHQDQNERMIIRNNLGFDEKDFVVVFSGRLDPTKNFELLLDIFECCHNVDKAIKLLVVGDGPERQKIEQICMQKKIDASLFMVGRQFDVLPYLRAGDAFLLTSLTEQMPLTILEAMSVGLPVVASDVGEISKIIDDGQNGFVRNIRDGCEGFATALLSLKQSSNWQTMSRAARSKIVVGFQEAMMVRSYQTLIEDLLGHHRR